MQQIYNKLSNKSKFSTVNPQHLVMSQYFGFDATNCSTTNLQHFVQQNRKNPNQRRIETFVVFLGLLYLQ